MRALVTFHGGRATAALLSLLLIACASAPPGGPTILIETAARGQPVAGANCVATIGSVHWNVITPAVLKIGEARGGLRLVCDKSGFRTSELIFRSEQGTAPFVYPKRFVIDLNPA